MYITVKPGNEAVGIQKHTLYVISYKLPWVLEIQLHHTKKAAFIHLSKILGKKDIIFILDQSNSYNKKKFQ